MPQSAISAYLSGRNPDQIDSGMIAYLGNLQEVSKVSPGICKSIVKELADQRSNLKLIASENYCSLSTQLAMGNLLTDKYAEGYPFHRFYAGCSNVDDIEAYAAEQACKLFGAEHAYVHPQRCRCKSDCLLGYLNSTSRFPNWKNRVKQTPQSSPRKTGIHSGKLGNQRLLEWITLGQALNPG